MGPRRNYGIDSYLGERKEELTKASKKVDQINSQPIGKTLGLPGSGNMKKASTKAIVIKGTQPAHPGSGAGLGNRPKAAKKTAPAAVRKAKVAKTTSRKKTTIGKAKVVKPIARRKGRVTKAR
jgi:hypothetical protein